MECPVIHQILGTLLGHCVGVGHLANQTVPHLLQSFIVKCAVDLQEYEVLVKILPSLR